MRFRVRFCGGCQRFVLIEDNKHMCIAGDVPPEERLPPERRFEKADRVTRIYYSMEDMVRDMERVKEDMPCPWCGTRMMDMDDSCTVPLIQIEGRFE
jgi:hypothetical protein